MICRRSKLLLQCLSIQATSEFSGSGVVKRISFVGSAGVPRMPNFQDFRKCTPLRPHYILNRSAVPYLRYSPRSQNFISQWRPLKKSFAQTGAALIFHLQPKTSSGDINELTILCCLGSVLLFNTCVFYRKNSWIVRCYKTCL